MRLPSSREPSGEPASRLPRRLLLIALLSIVVLALVLPLRVNAHDRFRNIYRGETLVDIALEYNTTPETLRWLNNMAPGEPVWAGQRLMVPPRKGLMLHEVQPKESAASIAAKSGMPVAQFVEMNKVSPQQRLRPGARYYVPAQDGLLASKEVPVHVVREGDSLEALADRYRSSVKEILSVNELTEKQALVPGTQLLVPALSLHTRIGNAPEGKNGFPLIDIRDFPSLTEKWVEVDLSTQRVVAWEGVRPLRSFVISSGTWRTPTVTGVFRIRAKVPSQRMSGGSEETGDAYSLAGVPWVSYFFEAFSFHGTYWHNNFGVPMSHGCINMKTPEAEWLYKWMTPENPTEEWYNTSPDERGTLVIVHK